MKKIKIGSKIISYNHRPFIIAEMSGNHNKSLDRALKLVKEAHKSGADALKLQTYRPDTITINHKGGLFNINDPKSIWNGKNLFELYGEAYTPWEWHKEIFDYAKSLGMIAFSSPFDESAVDFLEKLDVPAYKIASFESNHFPLLKKVAKTKKPIFISSGASNLNELFEAVRYLEINGAKDIIIFKCTSTYPAKSNHSNLSTIPALISIFPDNIIGLSDHTMGIGVPIASIAFGARVIEKHITINRMDGGVDSKFSLEPHELKLLVTESKRAFNSIGKVQLKSQKSEKKSLQFKRSIYIVKDIKIGEKFTPNNIAVIRPGDGLHPKHYEKLLNMISKKNLFKGTPFSWDML